MEPSDARPNPFEDLQGITSEYSFSIPELPCDEQSWWKSLFNYSAFIASS